MSLDSILDRELSFKQEESIFTSNSRVNIWEGAVRAGKTHASLLRWILFVLSGPQGDYLMVGKTFSSLIRNAVMPILQMMGVDAKFYRSYGELHIYGKRVYCFGADSKEAEGKIRGGTFVGCYIDEVTLVHKDMFKMILSRLSVKGAMLFGTTNPDAPKHWLKKEYIDRSVDLGYKIFKFEIDDNIFLDPDYVKSLKKEYTGLWYKRFIKGLWVQAEGAIYDFFRNGEPYIITETPKPTYYCSSIDYGTKNPFWCGLFGVNPYTTPKVWLEREYVYCGRDRGVQKTDGEYSEDLKEFYGDIKPLKIYVDPSASSFITQLKRDGFSGVTKANNSVIDGIRTQSKMLKNGEYAIKKGNDFAIEEYESYIWDEKKQDKGEDIPTKEYDHSKDGERYMVHTHFGMSTYDINLLVQD